MKKQIVFWNNEKPVITKNQLNYKPASGTWNTVINLAKVLDEVGYQTIISHDIHQVKKLKNKDVLIVLKNPVTALELSHSFKKTFLWCHNDTNNLEYLPLKNSMFIKKFLKQDIQLIAVSYYLKQNILKNTKIPNKKIIVIPNGVDHQLFKQQYSRNNDCIFVAPPYRGLDKLIEIWQTVVAKRPNSTLKIFSSQSLYGLKDSKKDISLINTAKKLKGVTICPLTGQKQLIKELLKSKIFIYPATTFKETSSIATLQAKAAGCVIITHNAGALKENAQDNIILDINDPAKKYAQNILNLLNQQTILSKISHDNKKTIQTIAWKAIKDQWIRIIN